MAELGTDNEGEWAQFRAELLAEPEHREVYDRTLREVMLLRLILQQVEEARASAGLSKAQLAQRMGIHPASLRRLLTSEKGNPTFRTMLGVFDALGLEMTLKRTKSHDTNGHERATPARGRKHARKARSAEPLAS